MENVKIKVTLEGSDEDIKRVLDNPSELQSLCRSEVENFHQSLKVYGMEYSEGLDPLEKASVQVLLEDTIRRNGLTPFTKKAASGFLYQKIKGRI